MSMYNSLRFFLHHKGLLFIIGESQSVFEEQGYAALVGKGIGFGVDHLKGGGTISTLQTKRKVSSELRIRKPPCALKAALYSTYLDNQEENVWAQ